MKVAELCRKYGISEATYYSRKTRYAGMMVSELCRLKTLVASNRRLKQIVAEQTLDMQMLKELLAKKLLMPEARKAAVVYALACLGRSIRKAW